MSEVEDAARDAIEEGRTSRLHSAVALLVALTATFMALCNIKDGNIVQAMSQAQARAVDTWALFQSKSTKEHLAQNALDLVGLQAVLAGRGGADAARELPALRARYEAQVRLYAAEKDSIQRVAEALERRYDALNVHDDQFDLAEACFSVALATLGVAALTRRRWLLVLGAGLAAAGAIMGIAGFMGWALHSDAFSKLLG